MKTHREATQQAMPLRRTQEPLQQLSRLGRDRESQGRLIVLLGLPNAIDDVQELAHDSYQNDHLGLASRLQTLGPLLHVGTDAQSDHRAHIHAAA